MQAHYSVDSFSAAQFKTVAKKYAEAAGKVQLTELDFQASAAYKSGAASKESEYTKMAYCHKQLFDAAKDLKKNGTNVAGITAKNAIAAFAASGAFCITIVSHLDSNQANIPN